jgi:hypothetical protein
MAMYYMNIYMERLPLNDFKIKTTVLYTIRVSVDNVYPTFTTDVFTCIFKNNINDTDEEAVLVKTGTFTDVDGEVKFTFSATDTDIDAHLYYYEIKWEVNGAVYIVESSTVAVLKRVFD